MDESYNPAPKIYIIIRNDISYINNGSTFSRTDWWVNFFNVQIIVSELQRFSSKLLTVKSNINIELKSIFNSIQLWIIKTRNLAYNSSIFKSSICPIPTTQRIFIS